MRHIDAECNGIERTFLTNSSAKRFQIRSRFESELRPVTGAIELVACQSVLAGMLGHVISACCYPSPIMSDS
jgi:hypothetical protein